MTTPPKRYASWTQGKLPLTELAEMKRRGERIAMVTAYDFPSARLADAAGVDIVLVGDSAAMTVLGYDSTVPATVAEMLVLTRAAVRGAKRPLVLADMPFGSFQVSDENALANAIRDACGARLTELPITSERVRQALATDGAGKG